MKQEKNMNKQKQLGKLDPNPRDVIYQDFCKASDTVPHNITELQNVRGWKEPLWVI